MNSLDLIMKMMEGPKTTVEQVHLSTVMHLKMNPTGVLNLGWPTEICEHMFCLSGLISRLSMGNYISKCCQHCRMNRSTWNPINFGSFLWSITPQHSNCTRENIKRCPYSARYGHIDVDPLATGQKLRTKKIDQLCPNIAHPVKMAMFIGRWFTSWWNVVHLYPVAWPADPKKKTASSSNWPWPGGGCRTKKCDLSSNLWELTLNKHWNNKH